MKLKTNWWLYIIFFLVGCLVSYWLSQFKILKIDLEVNVSDVLLAIITSVIGIYIALSIQTKLNKDQNRHDYLEKRFSELWDKFISFSASIKQVDSIDLLSVSSSFHDCNKQLVIIEKIFDVFELPKNNVTALSNQLDDLQKLIENNMTRDNIIYYQQSKSTIVANSERLNVTFSKVLKDINSL